MIKYLKEIWSDYVKLYKSLSFLQKYFLLLLLALLAYLPLMRGYVNTHDEMWTLLMARKPFDEMMKIVIADDGNPPLYYIYERFWDYFDNDKLNVFWSRFGNFFILFLTSLLGLFPIRRLFGDRVSLLFCALVFIMPPSFYLVTDIRGYRLSGLLVAGAFVYALCICYNNKRGDWFWLALCSLLGMYNHYLCGIWNILIWGGLFLYLLRQKRYKDIGKMFLWGAFVSLAYLPWLLVFINQYGSMKANWYPKLGYAELAAFAFFFMFRETSAFYVVMSAFLWSLMLEFTLENRAERKRVYAVAWFIIICLLFYFISYFISSLLRPMLIGRYLYPFLVMFYLCASIVLVYYKKYRKFFAVMLLPTVILSYSLNYEEMQDKTYMSMSEYVKQNVPENSLLIFNHSREHLAVRFYLPEYDYAYAPSNITLILSQDEVQNMHNKLKKYDEYDGIYYFRSTEARANTIVNEEFLDLCTYSYKPHRQFGGCLGKTTAEQAEKIMFYSAPVLKASYH